MEEVIPISLMVIIFCALGFGVGLIAGLCAHSRYIKKDINTVKDKVIKSFMQDMEKSGMDAQKIFGKETEK